MKQKMHIIPVQINIHQETSVSNYFFELFHNQYLFIFKMILIIIGTSLDIEEEASGFRSFRFHTHGVFRVVPPSRKQ